MVDNVGQSKQRKALTRKKAPYVPGGDTEFGRDWEKPKRKPAKSKVPKDTVTREGLLKLRLDLQYDVPNEGPAPVPIMFGGELSVKAYTDRVYDASLGILGISSHVSYDLVWYRESPNSYIRPSVTSARPASSWRYLSSFRHTTIRTIRMPSGKLKVLSSVEDTGSRYRSLPTSGKRKH